MAHQHDHVASYNRAFAIGIGLNLGFVAVEASFGYAAHSLALIADAGHNLSDVLGLLLAWAGTLLARRAPTPRHTYGWRRASILAALANAMVLLVALGSIASEAVRRFAEPQPVEEITVIWVALAGIVVNAATALLFLRDSQNDINIRGAFLHMAADAAVSVGVVLAAAMTLATGWLWIDPLVSLLIAVVILVGTWGLLHESLTLALDGVPRHIDAIGIDHYLRSIQGVSDAHDIHIWALSTTEVALTAHLVVPLADDRDALLHTTCTELHDRFGIEHTTIQLETRRCPTSRSLSSNRV